MKFSSIFLFSSVLSSVLISTRSTGQQVTGSGSELTFGKGAGVARTVQTMASLWQSNGVARFCKRRGYCSPDRIHLEKSCCFITSCRSRPGVLGKCQQWLKLEVTSNKDNNKNEKEKDNNDKKDKDK